MGVPAALYACIAESKEEGIPLSVTEMCTLAGVSRSGYYAWKRAAPTRQAREEQDQKDFGLILQVYNRHGYSKGVESIHMGLLHLDPHVCMNVKKIRRLMRKYGLICPIRKPHPARQLAKELEESTVAPNVLQREFRSYGPRSVLLTDISYLPYGDGKTAYLSTIEDAYTKEVLAWVVSESMEVEFVLDTLRQLSEGHGEELADAVMVHSDQGSHYKSRAFRDALADKEFIQSMSRRANCWDNQVMEYFFGTLKDHVRALLAGCETSEKVTEEVGRFIHYYNYDRPQMTLAKLTPTEYYQFCVTGEYPLPVANPPEAPKAEKTPEDMHRRAHEAYAQHAQRAGTKASDSTLDFVAPEGEEVRAALAEVTRKT